METLDFKVGKPFPSANQPVACGLLKRGKPRWKKPMKAREFQRNPSLTAISGEVKDPRPEAIDAA